MKLIEVNNNTAQTVTSGSPLLLGNISRRVGCITDYSAPATTLTLRETGFYQVIFKVNTESTVVTQPVEVTLFLDGVAQPETTATDVIAAVGDNATLNTNKIVRVFCNSAATISFINTGADDAIYDALVLDILKVV